MSVDEYLDSAPEPHRSTLTELRATLRSILPDATEELAYGVPAFRVDGKSVAGFAYFTKHCSYLPHSGTVLSELSDELDGYEWSKGSIKFPPDQTLPPDLVAKLVEARMREIGS